MTGRACVLSIAIATMSACAIEGADHLGQIEPPPVNHEVVNQMGPISRAMTIECAGPQLEIDNLGALCGASTDDTFWSATGEDEGMGVSIGARDGGARILIFNHLPKVTRGANVAASLEYSAFIALDPEALVSDWPIAERVEGGEVLTQRAEFIECDWDSWQAEAVLYWRNTTISLAWFAGLPC